MKTNHERVFGHRPPQVTPPNYWFEKVEAPHNHVSMTAGEAEAHPANWVLVTNGAHGRQNKQAIEHVPGGSHRMSASGFVDTMPTRFWKLSQEERDKHYEEYPPGPNELKRIKEMEQEV